MTQMTIILIAGYARFPSVVPTYNIRGNHISFQIANVFCTTCDVLGLRIRLQGLYPETGGVPPSTSRPIILLIVRTTKRKLHNNDEVSRNTNYR